MGQQSGASSSLRSLMNEATSSVLTSHAISDWLRTKSEPSPVEKEVDRQFFQLK
jgi:hypothetical protein